jgi:ubiquinone/menaquinone biosynthesis C-methylase UbiE
MSYDSAQYSRVQRLDPHHERAVASALGADLTGQRILEVGCGRGFLLRLLQEAGADAIGIDANPQSIATAVTAGTAVGDAQALDHPDAAFDAIVSVHTIEHLPDMDAALAEMARVLRPGGRMVLVYPAEPIQGLWAIPTAIILHRNPLKAREVHCNKVTPGRLRARMADLPVTHVESRFSWRGWPQYASVFDRD